MLNIKDYEVWLVTGSQHLYGEEPLRQIAENSKKIVIFSEGTDCRSDSL